MRGVKNTIESLMLQVEKTSGHWLWTGKLSRDGYGIAKWQGKDRRVHRIFYEHFKGPIPPGHDVDHIQDDGLCGIRNCCDPDHLRAVTHRDNLMTSTSFVAVKAAQTHCIRDHEFTIENTTIRTNGTRQCIQCRRDRQKAGRARRKEIA